MRKSVFTGAATLMLAVAFTSCYMNDDINDGNNEAVRFTAGIVQQAVPNAPAGTRAAGIAWEAGDRLAIFMMENGTTTIAENASNKEYETLTGTNSFTAVSGNEMYYPMDGSAVDFIAYYPVVSGATLGTAINVTIGNQTDAGQPLFDLLWAKADNSSSGYTKTYSGNVALGFEHKLAKIVMNTTADASVGVALTGMSVKINNMYTQNTFDLSTGELGATATDPLAITPRTVIDGQVYDAIIMPGSYSAGDITVEFTVGGDTFTWTLDADAASFIGGNEYIYAVELTRTGVSVSSSINAWITGGANDRGSVTAE